jgi:Tol biopolymer transport system component
VKLNRTRVLLVLLLAIVGIAAYAGNVLATPGTGFTGMRLARGEFGEILIYGKSTPRDVQTPAWSPDGRKLAFVSRRDGNSEIYVMNADGSDQRNLTRHAASDQSPAWSPDGQSIAFVSRRSGLAEIHVMNADGSDQRNLRVRVGRDSGLGWSPDGRKIAFTAGSTEVYVVNADGSGRRQLTRSPWANWFAGWSPGPRTGS